MVDKIAENFEAFHRANPVVYRLFQHYAAVMINRIGRASAKLIFERIRWERMIQTGDVPKLNNNYTALYARMYERDMPKHRGMFAKRKRRRHTIDSTDFDEPDET